MCQHFKINSRPGLEIDSISWFPPERKCDTAIGNTQAFPTRTANWQEVIDQLLFACFPNSVLLVVSTVFTTVLQRAALFQKKSPFASPCKSLHSQTKLNQVNWPSSATRLTKLMIEIQSIVYSGLACFWKNSMQISLFSQRMKGISLFFMVFDDQNCSTV